MLDDQFWKPDSQTRSAIRRGNRLSREYFERKQQEYAERYAARLLWLKAKAAHQE